VKDIALLFPPQWSPFQPSLSVPSLAAWLRREGFSVHSLDANLGFYQWLYRESCVSHCKGLIDQSTACRAEKIAYGAVLDAAPDFAADITRLQQLFSRGPVSDEDLIRSHFVAVNSMDVYLDSISKLAKNFKVSPFMFETEAGDYNSIALQRLVENPPRLLEMFVDEYLTSNVIPLEPRCLGLSCIGQEQLFFSLLFGKRAKQLMNIPVIVGGTIFSRIFERGALPIDWFERYFDVIVRNEGEKPASSLLANLTLDRPLTGDVPGIVYRTSSGLAASNASCPLKPTELPVPDFDGLPLKSYIASHLSLPLLSSRGCYWGKCEFCHHGMVYGEKYASYDAQAVLDTVQTYARQYGAKHFAFNDEAIPPKIARSIGQIFPDTQESSWAFTGLIKFEEFFKKDDFVNLRRIGFRSLYVGLESASERVLELMRKHSKKSTIVRNLADAADAGIWMHCFLFFGFPGETETDAKETYDFILEHDDIIGSFGCGAFSLEHNAPIFRHLGDFPVQLEATPSSSVNVYYNYRVSDGISSERAEEWAAKLNEDAARMPKYFASTWIPREHLLELLASMTPAELVEAGRSLRSAGNVAASASTREIFSLVNADEGENGGPVIAIDRSGQRIIKLTGASASLFRLIHDADLSLASLRVQGPAFYERLIGATRPESPDETEKSYSALAGASAAAPSDCVQP
jgi:hypothetical protein